MKRSCILLALLALVSACKSAPDQSAELISDAEIAVAEFKKKAPKITPFFNNSFGYAIFPTIGQGGLVIGAALGTGVLYAQGKEIGTVALTEWTLGPQIGGQSFRQVVFFEGKSQLEAFKTVGYEFKAGLSAIAIVKGVAIDSSYANGVRVFTLPIGGMMAEASVGGQRFDYMASEAAK